MGKTVVARHSMVPWLGIAIVLAGITFGPSILLGQTVVTADSTRAKRGSQFLIPLGSIALPGLGQYVHGAPLLGAGFTGAAALGIGVSQLDATGDFASGTFPRAGRDQLSFEGAHLWITSGSLSAWDAFRRAMPRLKGEGKYRFLAPTEGVGDLLTAPFDVRFLTRWTTWVNMALTAVVTGVVITQRDDDVLYHPYRGHDVAFTGAASYNAGVGEEALFRGWLLPLFHQVSGERFWAANVVQAGLFGAGHIPQAGVYSLMISAWGLYQGWLTQKNGWSIRESIFHHFWYDVSVVTATLIADEQAAARIAFPTIRF